MDTTFLLFKLVGYMRVTVIFGYFGAVLEKIFLPMKDCYITIFITPYQGTIIPAVFAIIVIVTFVVYHI